MSQLRQTESYNALSTNDSGSASTVSNAAIRNAALLQSPLASIIYRSRAIAPLSGYELYELVQAAQLRNAALAITGLILYDNGRFYQWLEGPADKVATVMASIMRDPRHTEIEILCDKPITVRQFSDWSMRLASRGVRSIHSGQNVITPSPAMLEALQNTPHQAEAILGTLSPAKADGADAKSNYPLQGAAGHLLKNVIVAAVIPELVMRHEKIAISRVWPADSRARALADLLLSADTGTIVELLRSLQTEEGSKGQLYKTLVEPAARRLGDLWLADACTEFDVTYGLGQLQRAIRTLNEEAAPIVEITAFMPAVLIVPEPGEIHSLNAALDSDMLWNAGWEAQAEFPSSDEALQDMMAGSWFDALDLSLSTAFRREHWLPRVTRTIALARHASRNPALVVVVAGRVFAEDSGAGVAVGADGATTTAVNAEQAIRDGLHKLHGGD